MSRIGKQPITLPSGVEVKVADGVVNVKGKQGQQSLALYAGIDVSVADNEVNVSPANAEKQTRAMYGTTRALLQNMVTGVSEGYKRALEIQGVGYRVQLQGKKLVFNIGFCHPVEYEAPEGISFVCPDQTHIEVTGASKQQVGQVAAEIRSIRKPEPYKGKGIRYVGEYVRRKAGKSAKK